MQGKAERSSTEKDMYVQEQILVFLWNILAILTQIH